MMKLAQRLSFLNSSGVHRHTSGLARRAVLVLSLLLFCFGSVWGQIQYDEIQLYDSDGHQGDRFSLDTKYYDVEGCKLRFEFNSANENYTQGQEVTELVDDWGTGNVYKMRAESYVSQGNPFSVTLLLSTLNDAFKGAKLASYMYNPWGNSSRINRVILLVPQNPFSGNPPSDEKNRLEKTIRVSPRSASSVDISFNEVLATNPQYARFYLTDVKGNPVDPTGKLMVEYGLPCPKAEQGFYIAPEAYLTKEMFYNWNGYGADASVTSRANVEFNLETQVGKGDMICGTSTVDYLIYADLTGYTKMEFTGTSGTPLRVLLNRQESNSGPMEEKNLIIGDDGTVELDLTEFEYVHLNAIKAGWNDGGTVTSIKLVPAVDNTLDKSNIKLKLATPEAYKLYKVVCLFSNTAPEMDSDGKISKEPDFDLQYTYNFTYEDLKAEDTKKFTNSVEWKLGGMTPWATNYNPDEWGTISSEELAVERYVKWYVVKGDVNQPLAEYAGSRLEGEWTISGYPVNGNVAAKMETGTSSFPVCTIYAPAGQVYNDVKDCEVVCEIYANSAGTGSPNARYTFSLYKSFLGELKNPTKKGGELITLQDRDTHPEALSLSKVTTAWGSASRLKYARVWLTTSDGKMVDPSGKLTLLPEMTQYDNATYGYYLANENGISLNNITANLKLDAGAYGHYQVHVALSTDVLPESKESEPDYDYLYTFSFGYPWKTRYKTLIINNNDVNNPTVEPNLLSNWFELAGDCGVSRDNLGSSLYVRWYLADEYGMELPVNITAGSKGNWPNIFSYNNINGGGFWKNGGLSYYKNAGGDNTGTDESYKVTFTLWNNNLPEGYDYKNVRLVCVATTKNTSGFAYNGSDPEIQVKYVYSLKLQKELKTFAHYEGEAYRYLKEIGNDDQAKDYDYIEVDGSTPSNNFTWNILANDYNAIPDTRNIRQNVHTVDYYYYVKSGEPVELLLPLQDYATDGHSSTEPMAYFRWYDYKTDKTSTNLTKLGTMLEDNRDGWGVFAFMTGEPEKKTIGATFQAPPNFSGEIQIACDVSRYLDGMDESFTYLVHEPTLSIRYLFHIMPAETIAEEIKKAGSLTKVEEEIMDNTKGKPSSILEDEGRTVVSTNNGYGEFALRTKLTGLGNYYFYNNQNALTQAGSLWWYAYYKDNEGNWWRHLIQKRAYKDRDGRNMQYENFKYRTETYQAKYSLKKIWDDYGSGDFDGDWEKYDSNTKSWLQQNKNFNISCGDRIQMVACVNKDKEANSPGTDIMPIIWTELEFIDAKPLTLETILAAKEDGDKSIYERTAVYMNDHYGDENKKPKALLDFNEFSLLGMKKPTHSYENYATVPLHYPNAQYGFIYPQLYGYCGTMRTNQWGDGGAFGMAAMHGDYTLLKSMNMQGISMDKDNKRYPDNQWNNETVGFHDQSIQVDWVNGGKLFDVTHESSDEKEITENDNYGGFIYVDAADEARTIASLEFETELCKDAKIYYTAYVASMTGRTQSKDANGGSTGWSGDEWNSSPQTAPTLRFRVSTTRSGKNDGSERIPVMTFVTGNIRQEVQNANYDNGLFKEAQWYQVYGYTTIPETAGFTLDGSKRHFFVEIDNYCDNTDGADYCVDQISFYTDNCKVSVVQAAQTDCNDKGSKLNIYVQNDGIENITATDGTDRYIYWRICDNLGDPLTDSELYGDFLAPGEHEIPFGRTLVKSSDIVPDDKYALYDGETSGYFYMDIDGKKQLCFSLANISFDLMQGSNHYISVYSNGIPEDGKNAQGWGNQKDPCTVYSKIFIPKVMYVSIAGLTGGSTPPVDGGCPAGAASLVNFDIVLNVPDPADKETGFTPYPNVPFDFFKGTREELQGPNYGDEGNKFSLEYAINYYRNHAGIAEKDGKTVGWDYDCNHPEHDGLDPVFGEDESAEYYKYYLAIKEALDANKLHLSYSSTLSNLTVEKGNSTVWAISAKETMKDNYNDDHFVCSPLPLNFVVNDKLQHPEIMLGFDDVTYKENLRVVRVGKKQLNDMQNNGYLLHIPVKNYLANKDTEEKGKLGIISGGLELMKYEPELVAQENAENGVGKWTNDKDVENNIYVATFAESKVSGDKPYISLKFHGQYWDDETEEAKDVDKYPFKEGFTYRMFFQVKNEAMLDSLTACEANVEFLMKVVPEFVTWNGDTRQWNNDSNWQRSTCEELYKDGTHNTSTEAHPTGYKDNKELGITGNQAFVPMKFTYVTMPSKQRAPKLINLQAIDPKNKDIYTNINEIEGSTDKENLATDSIAYDLMVRYSLDPNDNQNKCQDHGKPGNIYDCEKYYGNWAKEIYFKPEAELINQQFLTYQKAWVEKELVANKWYLMSTPLKATYAGDMYVPYEIDKENTKVKGRQETEAFQPITFDDKVKVGEKDVSLYSRTKYPIYQRSWGTAHDSKVIVSKNDAFRSDYSAALKYTTWTGNIAEWGHTFNDVGVDYTKMTGFSIRAHKKDQKNGEDNVKALIRLPKKDVSYDYYQWNNTSPDEGKVTRTVDKDDYAKLIDMEETASITGEEPVYYKEVLLKDVQSQVKDADGYTYYLVGNPFMASLDMKKFFDVNTNLGQAYYTYEKSNAETNGVYGKIRPLQAFFVKAKNASGSIIFTDAMMMDGNHGTPTAPDPAPAMRMTAANDRGQSTATVSVSNEAKTVETLFDSNLNDVPMVYTVANGQAMSINQLTELDKPIAFGVTCAASDEPVAITFSDIEQLTSGEVYVVDAVTGEQTVVGEGSVLTVQPNDYGRYFLVAGALGIRDQVDVKQGIVVSVRGRVVTVTSGEMLTEVRALSLDGATAQQATAGSTTALLTLATPGVYIIKAENVAGEQLTVKVVVK